jgi:hypothetical protein
MIPLTAKDNLWVEDEKKRLKFKIRVITGENEQEYLEHIDKFQGGKTNRDRIPALNDMFDFMVLGWEAIEPDLKLIPFPSDGKPHNLFHYRFKDWLVNRAFDANNLMMEDSKN